MGKDIRKRDIYDDVFVANTERIFYVLRKMESINEKRNKINGGWHKQSKL